MHESQTDNQSALEELLKLRRKVKNVKEKLRKLRRRVRESGGSGSTDTRISQLEMDVQALCTQREKLWEVVAVAVNAAFQDLELLNGFLRGLKLPEAKTPDEAVRALKKGNVHINIYDIANRAFKPIYSTVHELAASIKRDKRVFPLVLAKASALKLFLRHLRSVW